MVKNVTYIKNRLRQRFRQISPINFFSPRKCDFLVIGVQKGGTTALDAYMRLHPGIELPYQKEIDLFNSKYYSYVQPVVDNFHSIYFPKPDFSKKRGEVTPSYCHSPNGLENIHRYNPDVKLVLLLRNPYLRAFSHWNMSVQNNTNKSTFKDAIVKEIQGLKEGKEKTYFNDYLYRSLYSIQVEEIYKYFAKESVLVLKSDQLLYEPNETLGMITDFIGVDKFDEIEPLTVHKREYNSGLTTECCEMMAEYIEPDLERLSGLVDWDFSEWHIQNHSA